MQSLYPPPLADLDLFRRHPPLLMFAHKLEASVMTTGRRGIRARKRLEKDRKMTNAINLRHTNFSTTTLILSHVARPVDVRS